MNITISTGIYPPELGGPAEYAKNLADVWRSQGNTVRVNVFSRFNHIPSGIRHIIYFFSVIPSVFSSDMILVLDTFSAALPTIIAAKIFRKKVILRTGGDFLWEAYVERTGDLVFLRNFYTQHVVPFSAKEKVVFSLIKFVLSRVDTVIWSTEWQRNIFMKPYALSRQRHIVIENYYGPRLEAYAAEQKDFIAATRPSRWKNLTRLKQVFDREEIKKTGAFLDMKSVPHNEFIEKIRRGYSLIIVSLGDISPNTILDAIRCGKPFIVTKETGLAERIKDIALFVDPEDENDIAEKVIWLSQPENYRAQQAKVAAFTFTHTWEEIAAEYVEIFRKISE